MSGDSRGPKSIVADERGALALRPTPDVGPRLDSPTALVVRVHGHPAKKGSKGPKGHVKGRCILVEMDKKLPEWTKAVQAAARNAVTASGWLMLGDACTASFWFWLPRPKTVTRPFPTGRGDGDVDKMIRAALDAMTGIVFVDDALVTDFGEVHQRYADGRPPGATIRIAAMSEALL